MVNQPRSFATQLRRYRLAASLSQDELAARAGLAAKAIGALERGERRRPYPQTVRALADALGLSGPERQAFVDAAKPNYVEDPVATPLGRPPLTRILPASVNSFVGREPEISALTDLVRSHRLVTLTGPGGVGKTRLALRVAEEIGPSFADGLAFISLAPIADPRLALLTIARALSLDEGAGLSFVQVLTRFLRDRAFLLVLDSLEHLLAIAPQLAEILVWCPRLTVIATSREILRLSGECVFEVPPLTLPAARAAATVEELSRSEAVRLFVERARLVKPGFALGVGNADPTGEVCRRLDGLPLAIELAAAQVRLLPTEALLERLGRRLPALVEGFRDAPALQQTLRDTIAWSYDLLDPGEKSLFRQFGVFVGGAGLPAIEGMLDRDTAAGSALGGVDLLVAKSLLRREIGPDGEPRYSMLDTIREYAREQLEAHGEADPARDRHAAWFLALAEDTRPAPAGPGAGAIERLEQEHENLRAALEWLQESGDLARAVRLSEALWPLWSTRGYYGEGKEHLDLLLAALGESGEPAAMAWLRQSAGEMTYMLGDLAAARSYFPPNVAYWRKTGDRARLCGALTVVGMTELGLGNSGRALPAFEEAVAISQALGDRETIVRSLLFLGVATCVQGDPERACALTEEALMIAREAGTAAPVIVELLINLGLFLEDLGENAPAEARYREGLAVALAVGYRRGVAFNLEGLGSIAGAAGQPARALRLIGAAAGLREEINSPVPVILRTRYERKLERARRQLPPQAADAAFAAGRAMAWPEAVAYALEES